VTDALHDHQAHDHQADAGMPAFGALVLADEALQARLGGIERPDAYVAEAIAIAAAHDITLDAEAIHAMIRPDPLGISRWMPSPVTLDRWPAPGWLPARGVQDGSGHNGSGHNGSGQDGSGQDGRTSGPAFDWAWFGSDALDAPFYEDAVRRFASRPFSLMFRTRTSLDALVTGASDAASAAPAGFIHHMSRCGSTLVAQLLGADPHHVVISEAEPLDAVVRWAMESGAGLNEQVAALRAIVAALGRDRSGQAPEQTPNQTRRVFFKLDSWHVMALPLFRAAFPETPWVFLYRNPVEVLVSQARERGIHTVAGLLPVGILDIPGAEGMAADHYAALVLERMGEAVLEHWHLGGGLLVDYAEMPTAILDRIAPHFGFVPDAGQRAAMTAVATRNAKAPDLPFVPDTATKRRDATPDIEAAARVFADPVHFRLEALAHLEA
jgi:hypothetical protein